MSEAHRLDALPSAKPRNPLFNWRMEGAATLLFLLVAWEAASYVSPPILFPPLATIANTFKQLFVGGELAAAATLTILRIVIALAITFVFSTALGIVGGFVPVVDRFVNPIVQFKQGVPSVCWIILSVLWFKDVEIRIAFIVVISTLPSFYYITRDALRGIPKDLWEMVQALRPSYLQILKVLILPALLPQMITGLRINMGAATRVAVFAELLGGVSGVGYHLRIAEEQFRMDVVMAWTSILVTLVLVSDKLLSLAEKWSLQNRGRVEMK
ncbi:MAG: ABC transporter permease [Pseudorhodoplanes sp.]